MNRRSHLASLAAVALVLCTGCADSPDMASETASTPKPVATTPTAPTPPPKAPQAMAKTHDYPGDPAHGEPTTTASGLQYFDLVEGTGPSPAGASTTVRVHYTGWLLDGKKFDSSVDRGEPSSFRLNQVIKGWTEGVGSMKVGGKRKLVIPSDLAYGPSGRAPVIPPSATLVFDIELLELP